MLVRGVLWLGAGLALGGCQTTSTMTCPPDAAFSAASQKRLAAELRAAAPEAEWPGYVVAYKRVRRACAALAGAR